MSVQTTMFGRKAGDSKRSALKVLDVKRDTVTRLKHIRVVLGRSFCIVNVINDRFRLLMGVTKHRTGPQI